MRSSERRATMAPRKTPAQPTSTRSAGKNWRQEAKITAADTVAADAFGFVVSIDGTTAVVGAPKADIGAAKNAGAAYVFVRDANRWKQHAKLVPEDAARSDALGEAVDIRKDTVIVGAPGHTHGGVRFAGAVFVFVRDGDAWREQAKLTANDAAPSDRFGVSVDIEGDTVIVGSLLNDAGGTKDAGAAYIFVHNGTTWTQQAKLIAPEKRKGDRFGAGGCHYRQDRRGWRTAPRGERTRRGCRLFLR